MKNILLIAVTLSLPVNAEVPSSFQKAKKIAQKYIYGDHKKTFYCGCDFDSKKKVNQQSCGYQPRTPITSSGKENKRDDRIEWEHVLPASFMGKNLSCWGSERGQFPQCVKPSGKLKSGRYCCQKMNQDFKNAHNDLVNLTPAIGEVNGDRSNLPYGEILGERRIYGQCDFEIDFDIDVVEPQDSIKGDIARIQLYLEQRYGEKLNFSFSDEKHELLKRWNQDDPVSSWEIERNKRICEQQGSGNDLVNEC